MRLVTCALVLPFLASCAAFALSEADCRGMNWQQRGYDDGFDGHPPQDLSLAWQCSKHRVVVAQADYAKGWASGHDEHVRLKSMKCD